MQKNHSRSDAKADCDTKSTFLQQHMMMPGTFDEALSGRTWIAVALVFSSLTCFRRSLSRLLRSRTCSLLSEPLLLPRKSTRLLFPTLPVNISLS